MPRTKAQTQNARRIAPTFDPPIPLEPAERDIWNQTLASVASDHFAAADLRMLAVYCKASAVLDTIHEQVAGDPAGDLRLLRTYKDMAATLSAFAGKLRLVPSSRTKQKEVAVEPIKALPKGFLGA